MKSYFILGCLFLTIYDCKGFTSDKAENFLQGYKYESSIVLDKMSNVLNKVKEKYKLKGVLKTYSVVDKKPIGFFVFDLTDTTNNTEIGAIKFKEGHVYHFAPKKKYLSFSNICILLKGKLFFFKALNCKNKINDVQEVISFVKRNMPNASNDLITRILDYKRFGRYLSADSPICKCEW